MADWHLIELEKSLNKIGWNVISRQEGNGYEVSGYWQIQRNSTRQIEFEGLDDLITLPIEKAYACYVTGSSISLYFYKKGRTWTNALAEFMEQVNQLK